MVPIVLCKRLLEAYWSITILIPMILISKNPEAVPEHVLKPLQYNIKKSHEYMHINLYMCISYIYTYEMM